MAGPRTRVRVTKGHGTGNDFVVLADPDGALALSDAQVAALCDRRTGIGADGLLRVVRTANLPDLAALAGEATWAMDYRNADGSVAEMCGNGIRVFAAWLRRAGWITPGEVPVATRSGVRRLDVPPDGDITAQMGPARLPGTLARAGGTAGLAVDLGNPHLAVPVADVNALARPLPPPALDPPGAFPAGVNVEYVQVTGPAQLRMRVHERGVGETASCGTGAVAAAVAAAVWSGAGRAEGGALALDVPATWQVLVPGGTLQVGLATGGTTLCGPAVLVADAELTDGWLPAR